MHWKAILKYCNKKVGKVSALGFESARFMDESVRSSRRKQKKASLPGWLVDFFVVLSFSVHEAHRIIRGREAPEEKGFPAFFISTRGEHAH